MNLKDITAARRSIEHGFVWRDTPQGWSYWSKVFAELRKLEAIAQGDLATMPGRVKP